jgi:hypothetical protein
VSEQPKNSLPTSLWAVACILLILIVGGGGFYYLTQLNSQRSSQRAELAACVNKAQQEAAYWTSPAVLNANDGVSPESSSQIQQTEDTQVSACKAQYPTN